jgi:phosphonate transport system substrate-binding protein
MKKLLSAIIASTVLSTAAFSGGHSISEFRIGILGGENAQDRMTNNECFRQKAEDLLGVPSKIFAPADYDGVIQGLLGGTIDMAWLGASGYAKTYISDPEAVEPIVVAVNMDGGYGYYSVGFARKDSGIKSLDDMKGKVFGFGDPNSTSAQVRTFGIILGRSAGGVKLPSVGLVLNASKHASRLVMATIPLDVFFCSGNDS